MSDYAIPVIGCFLFILLGIGRTSSPWCPLALIAGTGGLIILFSSSIIGFLKNEPSQ